MNYYFITGTSRGIGKAITENLLENDDNYVIGFSRSNSIKHERFEYVAFDLRDIENVKNYQFINIIDADSITLVNNSGLLGSVKHVGRIDNQSIIDVFNVNTVAPFVLINNFVTAYQQLNIKKLVINISSGAASHPIESWSAYCASKSALNMISEVVCKEQFIYNNQKSIKILSIAPGIVDTQMQEEIRSVDRPDFALLDTFLKYKEDNLLASVDETAKKIIKVIHLSDSFLKPVLDLRELEI